MALEQEIETVRDDLTSRQQARLISKLKGNGFRIDGAHIIPKVIKKGHPSSVGMLLPVGYLNNGKAELINIDLEFPEDYHGQLREIYNSI